MPSGPTAATILGTLPERAQVLIDSDAQQARHGEDDPFDHREQHKVQVEYGKERSGSYQYGGCDVPGRLAIGQDERHARCTGFGTEAIRTVHRGK